MRPRAVTSVRRRGPSPSNDRVSAHRCEIALEPGTIMEHTAEPPGEPRADVVDGHGPHAAQRPSTDLARLVEELRSLIDQVARTEAPTPALEAATAAVRQASAVLAPHTPSWAPSIYARIGPMVQPQDFFPFSPVIGRWNPLAPPLTFEIGEDRVVRGAGVLGAAYEGPPGCVHGGMVAEILDELCGCAAIAGGAPGMTGTLTIRYRNPTPLHTELTLEARLAEVEGRKSRVVGSISAGGVVCAEAEGIFIKVDRSRFAGLLEVAPEER